MHPPPRGLVEHATIPCRALQAYPWRRRRHGAAAAAEPQGGGVIDRVFLSAQGLLEDAFDLAHRIYVSGFRPTFIVALWRGGVPIGLAVQEYLAHRGVPSDHIAIRTASYTGIDQQSREVAVYGLGYLVKNVEAEDRVLLVDDVFDTGRTALAVIDELRAKLRANMPGEVRIAVPYYKPSRREVDLEPDYFLHETSAWLKYPHSLEGLSPEEMAEHRPHIWEIVGPHLAGGDAD